MLVAFRENWSYREEPKKNFRIFFVSSSSEEERCRKMIAQNDLLRCSCLNHGIKMEC